MPSSSRFRASLSPISRSPKATSPAIRGSPTTVPTTRCRQLSGVTCPPSCPMTIGAANAGWQELQGATAYSNVRVMTTASSAGPDRPSSPRVYVKAPLRVRMAPAFSSPFAVYSRVVILDIVAQRKRRDFSRPSLPAAPCHQSTIANRFPSSRALHHNVKASDIARVTVIGLNMSHLSRAAASTLFNKRTLTPGVALALLVIVVSCELTSSLYALSTRPPPCSHIVNGFWRKVISLAYR